MAREPKVTRTIVTTKAVLMCVDTETAEVFNKEVVLPRTYASEEKLLKKAKAVVENDTTKVVSVVSKDEVSTLYGMSEQVFIEHAEVLPPREA